MLKPVREQIRLFRQITVAEGNVIEVQGKIEKGAQRLEIFLESENGKNYLGDIQFYMLINFEDVQQISCGAHKKESGWDGNNKFALLQQTPKIKPGENFKFSIFADHEIFFVKINGKPCCTLRYSMHLEEIKDVAIYGGLELGCKLKIHEMAHSKKEICVRAH